MSSWPIIEWFEKKDTNLILVTHLNSLEDPASLRRARLASEMALLEAASSGLDLARFSLCFSFLSAAFSPLVSIGLLLSIIFVL